MWVAAETSSVGEGEVKLRRSARIAQLQSSQPPATKSPRGRRTPSKTRPLPCDSLEPQLGSTKHKLSSGIQPVSKASSKPARSQVRQGLHRKLSQEEHKELARQETGLQKSSRVLSWVKDLPEQDHTPPGNLNADRYLSTDFHQEMDSEIGPSGATPNSPAPTPTPSKAASDSAPSKSTNAIANMGRQLRRRRANPRTRTDDPLLGTLKELLDVRERVRLPSADVGDLLGFMQRFIDKARGSRPTEDMYEDFEAFRCRMNAWLPAHKLFTMTNQDFKADVELSSWNNEAILQRTVMVSMLDRWRLSELFTFNCEGQLRSAKRNPLPAAEGTEALKELKPDLVIHYHFETFIGEPYTDDLQIPLEMDKFVFMDDEDDRCFPFVFIEAKAGDSSFTSAKYSNMLNTTQALWNIYKWMQAGDQVEAFFKHVRVFSITINVEQILVRVHRAESDPCKEGSLLFRFDEIDQLHRYTRDQASLLIRNLLLEYGLARLRGYLIAAYEKIIDRKLPSLREIGVLWKLPEVRDAVLRMEISLAEEKAGEVA